MWQKVMEVIKAGKILVSWNFLSFMYQMSPSLQLTNPPRCVIVQKEGSFQTRHFPNFPPKFLNKWLYARGKDEEGGGGADIQTQKACSQKCCVVDTRAWPDAEALPSASRGLGHRAPFDTTLSPTPFFWDGSSNQPCPKNCTEVSGTWSNNNTQWGLLSLIKQEPLPDKSQGPFWECPQPQEASCSTSLLELLSSK